MPAPAVYVIAVLGTVGVAIAFKEFIYPRLAPRIDQWKAEFQAAKKRRVEAERSSVPEVPLTQRGVDRDGRQIDQIDERQSDHSGKGSPSLRPSANPYLKNGLLIRRRSGSNPGDVELNWITSTSTATETGSQQHDLRLRKNIVPLNESSHDLSKKTTATHAFLDESIQPIPYTPLAPIRTPTPTHNSSSMHSPLDSTKVVSPLPGVALLSKSKADDINTSTYPLLAPLQPPSSSPSPMINASASNAESFPPSPGLVNIAVPGVAPFPPVSVDGTRIPDSLTTSLPPIIPLTSPSVLARSSLPSQLLSPTGSHPSPYQTPPHVHAIPSLSQSYPLDDVLDYEHGLELLSPPSPLSRTESPFELTGLSPRPGMLDRSTLLSVGRDQSSPSPVDSTNTSYISFSSPALSASSHIPSENGYENDFSPSDISSTFSSPFITPTRLGDIGSESLSPHDQVRLGLSSSGSSLPFDVNRLSRERSTGGTPTRASVSDFSAMTARSHESDARRSIISFNDNISDEYADTQTLRTRSPSTRTVTLSVATPSTSTEILDSAARLSKVTNDSDFDTGSELSDLDFLSMSAGEYEASALAPSTASGSVRLGSRSVVYTGTVDGSGMQGRVGGIGRSGTEDGNESDTSSWSLAGGSE